MCKCKAKKKEPCKICKITKGIVTALLAVTGLLFVVYFWNLDQKVLGWCYVQVNKIFDEKKQNLKF